MATRIGNIILCEHIAPGVGNKLSLIGVYAGDVFVASFPANLRFGVYVEHIPTDKTPYKIAFDILVGGKSLAKGEGGNPDPEPGQPAIVLLPALNLIMKEEGFFEMFLTIADEPPVRIINRRIQVGPISS